MNLQVRTFFTPASYDANDIRWWEEMSHTYRGFGYIGKSDSEVHIVKCPLCENENYMHQSVCIKCGFDPSLIMEGRT